jgi:hypothetical protein
MNDGIGVYTPLDRLPPTEKMGDSKRRVIPQEPSTKKRGRKRGQELVIEEDQEKKEGPADPSEGPQSGKILDVII